jgi:pSer/pThr/pTyr-binding forkhead associated (FHA) protein
MAALIQFASGAPGIKYSLNARLLTIGRGSTGNDICLPCSFVSKHHATIEVVESVENPGSYDYYLEDLGSTNKTLVNEKSIKRVKLQDGDVLRIGRTTLKFDAKGEQPYLEPLEVDLELPAMNQSRTWKLSRRLSLLGSE